VRVIYLDQLPWRQQTFGTERIERADRSMPKMTLKELEEQIDILDRRIDELTKPLPSTQVLRFAESLRSANPGNEQSRGTYSEEDYHNLRDTQAIANEILPQILKNLRAHSIDPDTGWRFELVAAGNGDAGLCAICERPYQHFGMTVKVHHLAMHPNAYYGVCRECVQQYASLEFVESEGVGEWLGNNLHVCKKVETDFKREGQRVALIDAIRTHAHSTHYFGEIVQKAAKWATGAFGEWR
jgi:hypothetical protein